MLLAKEVWVSVWSNPSCALPWRPACRVAWPVPNVQQRLRSRGDSCHFQTSHLHWPRTQAAGRQFPGAQGGTGRKALARCSEPPYGNSRLPRLASAGGSPDCTNKNRKHRQLGWTMFTTCIICKKRKTRRLRFPLNWIRPELNCQNKGTKDWNP